MSEILFKQAEHSYLCDFCEVISQHLRFTYKYFFKSKRQNLVEYGKL